MIGMIGRCDECGRVAPLVFGVCDECADKINALYSDTRELSNEQGAEFIKRISGLRVEPGAWTVIHTSDGALTFAPNELEKLRAQLAAIKDILENGANGEKLAAIERVVYGGESK